ncbi:MAG: flagellin [Gammaproteobacteria bacterium]|nr:flagellin [Gammaproteobacteria bacterium]
MALIVNSNIASLNAQRNLSKSQNDLGIALQRLSSGLRVNSAKDDAAGLYVSEQFTRDIRGTNQAVRNSADGISLAQTAEGALGEITKNLQRMREIAVQSANGTITDRSGLQAEVTQLEAENNRIISTTKFNGTPLLASGIDLSIQVGANNGDVVAITTPSGTTITAVSVATSAGANAALTSLSTDIDTLSKTRATFGAVQNRFEAVISNLQNYAENLTAARSRIMDADFAEETAKLTRAQILQQAGTTILAQANTIPQNALSLLQG